MPEDHPEYYTAAEAKEMAGLILRGSVRVLRGRSTARVDARIEELKRRANQRIAAEREAVEEARLRKVREKAQARAKRIVR
jgi:hypothetical protein